MSKVCIIISNLNRGGAELSMYKIVLSLKNEYDFFVISLTEDGVLGDYLISEGIRLYILNINKSLFKTFIDVNDILKKEKPDIVHTWMYHADLIGGLVARFLKVKKIIWSIRNTDLIKGTTLSTRIIGLSNAFFSYIIPDTISVVSFSALKNHKKFGYCKSKMILIPNGFSQSKQSFNSFEKLRFKNILSINQEDLIIGSVARFNEYKDHFTFVKACLLLLEKLNGSINISFLIVGKDVDNNSLRTIIEKSNYINNFHFIDETNDINKYFSIFDIFCLHSISEGFPNVLAEAMLMKCICVSTDVGDARIILNDDSKLVPPKSPIELANKLFETINLSDDEKEIIKLNNYNRVSNTYSIDKMINNYIKLYNS